MSHAAGILNTAPKRHLEYVLEDMQTYPNMDWCPNCGWMWPDNPIYDSLACECEEIP